MGSLRSIGSSVVPGRAVQFVDEQGSSWASSQFVGEQCSSRTSSVVRGQAVQFVNEQLLVGGNHRQIGRYGSIGSDADVSGKEFVAFDECPIEIGIRLDDFPGKQLVASGS